MAEATNVGAIYFDMVIRGSLEKQIQEIAAKSQVFVDKAFSGMEKTFASMANSITKQAAKPVEKFADTMAKSSEKMTDCFKKVSATPVEKALHKAQEQADKAAAKVRELESAIAALDVAADIQIAEEVQVFSESVKAARDKVKGLQAQIAAVKAEMAGASSQALSELLGKLQGQFYLARQALKVEKEILDQQRNAASEKVESSFAKQREKLYGQLAAAREQSAARAAKAAQMQASVEITAAQQTTAAIQTERAKQTAAQSAFSDPTEEVRTRMQAFAEALRADAQKAIDNSVWNRLSQYAQSFGDVAQDAFSKANGSAVSFGQIASQAFNKAGGVAGLFGGKIGMIVTIAKTAGNVISGVFAKAISKVKTGVIKVGSAVRKLTGNLNTAGKATRRFGSHLREIVRGALIFNGISTALRSMVSYMGESITASDSMKKALANLKGAAANAASPLLQVLTPALTKMANAAATALTYVERLMSRLTGKVSNAAATASKSTQKAVNSAKQAQRTLMGFDTLNRIDGKTETTADDGTDESDSIKPNYSYKGFSSFLESALAAVEAGRWTQVGELIAGKLNGILAKVKWDAIQQNVRRWTQNFVDTLNGFIHKVDFGLIGKTLGEGLDIITTVVDTYFQGIDWVSLGRCFADGLEGLLDTVNWPQLGRTLTDGLRVVFEWLHGFVTNFDFSKLGMRIGEMLKSAFGNINWSQLAADLNAGILGLLDTLIAFVQQIEWGKVKQTISNCLEKINWSAIGNKIGELLCSIQWGEIIGTVWDVITEYWKAKWKLFGSAVVGEIKELGKNVLKHFKEAGLNGIKGFLDGIENPIPTIASWLNKHLIDPLLDAVCDLLGIHSPSRVFAEIGKNLVLGLLEGLRDTWTEITNFVNNVLRRIKDTFSNAFEDVRDRLKSIWASIANFIKDAVNNVIASINSMISGIVNGVNAVIRALNRLSFTIPDWLRHVPGAANIAGKRFGFDLKTLTAPQIPYLADGGVIKQPTLAMIGEYSGARSNPEIVTPKSLMSETVSDVMEYAMRDVVSNMMSGLGALLEEQRLTREAVESIKVGDTVIGEAAARYARSARNRLGYFNY